MLSDRVFGFKGLFNNNTKQERKPQDEELTRTQVRKMTLQHYNGVLHENFNSIYVLLKFCPYIVFLTGRWGAGTSPD